LEKREQGKKKRRRHRHFSNKHYLFLDNALKSSDLNMTEKER